MTGIRRNPLHIRTRLCDTDHFRFQKLAKLFETTETNFARQAILHYLDRVEQNQLDRIESAYAQQIKSSTNRICALLSKVAMDARAIYFYLDESEPGVLSRCRVKARKLISQALSPEELDVAEKMSVRVSEVLATESNS